jgi:hypothetical protein
LKYYNSSSNELYLVKLILDPQAIIPTDRPTISSFSGPTIAAKEAAQAGSAVILKIS